MRAARQGSGDQDRGEQQRHQDGQAPGPGDRLPGYVCFPDRRQVGQQPIEVALGLRGQGLRDPLIELRLVESTLLEVLAEFGHHRVALGV